MPGSQNDIAACPLCGSSGRFTYAGRDLLLDRSETYDYYQCAVCHAVFQHPTPDADTIASFYPETYSVYSQERQPKKRRHLENAVLKSSYGYAHLRVPLLYRLVAPLASTLLYKDSIYYKPNGRALDVGCANGRLMRSLESIGWRCEGVEFNAIAVEKCRALGLTVHHGDLESAALPAASFDLITVRHVIEHLPNPNAFIKETGRLLRPHGWLLIMTPNSQALGRKWFREHWFANDVPRHLVLFSSSNLHTLASRSGLVPRITRLNTTPKIILNSIDYKTGSTGRPSRKSKLRRLLAKLYVLTAKVTRKGDEIYVIYEKA